MKNYKQKIKMQDNLQKIKIKNKVKIKIKIKIKKNKYKINNNKIKLKMIKKWKQKIIKLVLKCKHLKSLQVKYKVHLKFKFLLKKVLFKNLI